MGDRLRPLWNFRDLDATEARFRALLGGDDRAEVLTQLARVEGLRGDFPAGERLLAEAEERRDEGSAVAARVALERGRLLRSAGDPRAALPLFERAFEIALAAGEAFIAVDAAHMAALAVSDHHAIFGWTRRAMELAGESDDAEVRYWLGPLENNLGWEHHGRGEYEAALAAFRRALEAREQRPEQPAEIELARYSIGKTLRALGRADEAVALLEQAVAWAQSKGEPDGWFHEELAEEYAALGRAAQAGEQARLALPLLLEADPGFEADEERSARLRALADL